MVKHTVAQTNNILFNKYSQLETAATGIGAVICDNQQYCSFWKQLLQLLRRLPGCYCISYIRTGQYVSLKEEQRTTMEAFLDGIYDFTLLSTNICKSYFYQLALLAVPLSSCWSVCLKLTPWETVIDCLFAQSQQSHLEHWVRRLPKRGNSLYFLLWTAFICNYVGFTEYTRGGHHAAWISFFSLFVAKYETRHFVVIDKKFKLWDIYYIYNIYSYN